MNLSEYYEIVDSKCFEGIGPHHKIQKEGGTVYIRPVHDTERFSCNVLINPIVDDLRQTYGVNHKVDWEKDKLVPCKDGPFKMVTEMKDADIVLGATKEKLLEKLDEENLTDDRKLIVLQRIMKTRFEREPSFVENLTLDGCIAHIIVYIGLEAAQGFNAMMTFLSEHPKFPNMNFDDEKK
ncbi:predicted protein [Chaetoceros tenuissimus]|uniref:Uncharacterized protein n=1 Tax=Chaetoceros tenuissimus TaxID=426638 RepID=A0AAD3CPG2_9STRA|nr:predicted protein [Chaetoceros tenuissimus]